MVRTSYHLPEYFHWIWVWLLSTMPLPKPLCMDLNSTSSTIIALYRALLPKNSFHSKVQQWTHAHGIYWFYYAPHSPKVVGFIEVQWPFEDMLMAWTRPHVSEQDNTHPQKLLSPESIYGAVSPLVIIHRSKCLDIKVRLPPLSLSSSDLLTKHGSLPMM